MTENIFWSGVIALVTIMITFYVLAFKFLRLVDHLDLSAKALEDIHIHLKYTFVKLSPTLAVNLSQITHIELSPEETGGAVLFFSDGTTESLNSEEAKKFR